jgi:hypothetical protein
MPGFNINNKGGLPGFAADAPSNMMETRRTYRWYFETIGRGAGKGTWSAKELLVLQKAKRPTFKFSELDMQHQQEKAYYAGKQEWEACTLTWYDVEQDPNISQGLYIWLESVCRLDTIGVNHPKNYKKQATLKLVDGAGTTNERWDMYGTWPTNFNWQELDYTGDAILTCDATMRYDRAIRECYNPQIPSPLGTTCAPPS